MRPLRLVDARCDLCGGEESQPFASGTDFEYQTTDREFHFVRCRCDYVYLTPRPADDELGRIYPPTYYSYVQRENRAREGEPEGVIGRLRTRYHCAGLRRAFGGVADETGGFRVLDVGCGDGRFLDLMRVAFGEGIETHGIDFDEDAVAIAAKSGHRTQVGSVEDVESPDGYFHVIYISHVIEHLGSPRAFMNIARRLLVPGGVLHVETPNVGCAEARLFRRRYWGGYHFPRHWHLFTPETLARLADETGFDVQSVSYGTSPVFLNWTFHHLLWDHRAVRALSEIFSVTGIYKNDLRALVLLVGFALVERVLRLFSRGRGSGMVCALRKRSPNTGELAGNQETSEVKSR